MLSLAFAVRHQMPSSEHSARNRAVRDGLRYCRIDAMPRKSSESWPRPFHLSHVVGAIFASNMPIAILTASDNLPVQETPIVVLNVQVTSAGKSDERLSIQLLHARRTYCF
jgi:hypothetical protein